MYEIRKKQEIRKSRGGKSRKSEKVGNQTKVGTLKSRKSEKVINQKSDFFFNQLTKGSTKKNQDQLGHGQDLWSLFYFCNQSFNKFD